MENSLVLRKKTSLHPESIKLSRMDGELSSMLSNLHSYKFEPRTYDMHMQYQKLKGKGRKLQQYIDRTNQLVSTSKQFNADLSEEIDKVAQDYYRFQRRFSYYLAKISLQH